MFRKKSGPQLNLLELVPTRLFGFSEDDEGLVVVDMPRFHVPWMQKHLVPRAKHPFIRVKLDRFGSAVWNRMDGRTDVLAIADALRQEFGEAVDPVYERVGAFLRQLKDRGFVALRTREGSPV